MDVKYHVDYLKIKQKNFMQSMQASFARPSAAEKAILKGKVYNVLIDNNNNKKEDKKMKGSIKVKVQSGGWCTMEWRIKNKSEKDWPKGVLLHNNCEKHEPCMKPYKMNRLQPNQSALLTIDLYIPEGCDP